MKQSYLYEGYAGDDIRDVIPNVIAKAKQLDQDVFLMWNGATVRVSKKDDENKVLSNYYEEIHYRSLGTIGGREMNIKEKELLSKDLCARLMYRVKCFVPVENCIMELTGKRLNYFCFHKEEWAYNYSHEFEVVLDPLNDSHNGYIVKPYLRPMSSMTDKELVTFLEIRGMNLKSEELQSFRKGHTSIVSTLPSYSRHVDWLNAHHFDYRGLIPMGLALEAPEGMYGKEDEK